VILLLSKGALVEYKIKVNSSSWSMLSSIEEFLLLRLGSDTRDISNFLGYLSQGRGYENERDS
jgi:hypothetical protein